MWLAIETSQRRPSLYNGKRLFPNGICFTKLPLYSTLMHNTYVDTNNKTINVHTKARPNWLSVSRIRPICCMPHPCPKTLPYKKSISESMGLIWRAPLLQTPSTHTIIKLLLNDKNTYFVQRTLFESSMPLSSWYYFTYLPGQKLWLKSVNLWTDYNLVRPKWDNNKLRGW